MIMATVILTVLKHEIRFTNGTNGALKVIITKCSNTLDISALLRVVVYQFHGRFKCNSCFIHIPHVPHSYKLQ